MCFFIGKLEEGGEDAIAAGWGAGEAAAKADCTAEGGQPNLPLTEEF